MPTAAWDYALGTWEAGEPAKTRKAMNPTAASVRFMHNGRERSVANLSVAGTRWGKTEGALIATLRRSSRYQTGEILILNVKWK